MLQAGIDHLVLGCTHYPLLIPQLREILPGHVRIVDCSPAVALQTRAVLARHHLLNSGETPVVHAVFTNGNPEIANDMLERLGHGRDTCLLVD
jgi:glutamate racemase